MGIKLNDVFDALDIGEYIRHKKVFSWFISPQKPTQVNGGVNPNYYLRMPLEHVTCK
jgi:hypothetical protein